MNKNKLMPGDLAEAVAKVLSAAAAGKGERPQALTSYQILDRLPAELRATVIAERGFPGMGAGVSYSAASLVGDAAERITGVKRHYLDCRGIRFVVDGREIDPGYPVCGVYVLASE